MRPVFKNLAATVLSFAIGLAPLAALATNTEKVSEVEKLWQSYRLESSILEERNKEIVETTALFVYLEEAKNKILEIQEVIEKNEDSLNRLSPHHPQFESSVAKIEQYRSMIDALKSSISSRLEQATGFRDATLDDLNRKMHQLIQIQTEQKEIVASIKSQLVLKDPRFEKLADALQKKQKIESRMVYIKSLKHDLEQIKIQKSTTEAKMVVSALAFVYFGSIFALSSDALYGTKIKKILGGITIALPLMVAKYMIFDMNELNTQISKLLSQIELQESLYNQELDVLNDIFNRYEALIGMM